MLPNCAFCSPLFADAQRDSFVYALSDVVKWPFSLRPSWTYSKVVSFNVLIGRGWSAPSDYRHLQTWSEIARILVFCGRWLHINCKLKIQSKHIHCWVALCFDIAEYADIFQSSRNISERSLILYCKVISSKKIHYLFYRSCNFLVCVDYS